MRVAFEKLILRLTASHFMEFSGVTPLKFAMVTGVVFYEIMVLSEEERLFA